MMSFLPFELHPYWSLGIQIAYTLFIAAICFRALVDTRSVSKTLAYLLLIVFVPLLGAIFYLSFGINYRKRKIYNKKLKIDERLKQDFIRNIRHLETVLTEQPYPELKRFRQTRSLLSNPLLGSDPCMPNWELKVLQNGEEKFPRLIAEMEAARHHIHIQYYIFENDGIGNTIKELLIKKAAEGVVVRFIYDDFGSMRIRKAFIRELRDNGVKAYPFNRIRLIGLANRINYRNHRKIVVIDGRISFVGGINVADKYINSDSSPLFWRDTHLLINGYSTFALQQVFLADWNFCSGESLEMNDVYFPLEQEWPPMDNFAQIISSGPDSEKPNILYALVNAINSAQEEILLTTPYYIPDITLQESLVLAALSGKAVKLLVPGQGDSRLVTIASHSFFEELLQAGVEIYLYRKGFVHAKTFVIDKTLAGIGTANLDTRSFDLNFEVTAVIYDKEVASELAADFYNDLENADRLERRRWKIRSRWQIILEKIIRLISPFM